MRFCHLRCAVGSLLVAAVTSAVRAEIKVPPMLSQHMVLQREMAVPVWGTASSAEEVAFP